MLQSRFVLQTELLRFCPNDKVISKRSSHFKVLQSK